MIGRTFNPASYAMSHLRHSLFRSTATMVTLAITFAFMLLISSLVIGLGSRVDERQGLLDGRIPGSIDMFTEFDLGGELSDEARATLLTWLGMTAFLILVVSFFIVYNTMAITVEERRREIGILRSVGYSTGEVMRLFLMEGGLMGLISWTAALFLGMPLIVNLAAYLISRGDRGFFFVQPDIDMVLAGASLLVAEALCLTSTYLASFRRVNMPPAEILTGR